MVDITYGANVHDVDVVKDVGVRGHFRVADHHAHPTRIAIGGSMAFGEVVTRGVGGKEGARQANRRQVGFVDVPFHARDTVFKKVSDEGLAVTCAPIKRAPSGGDGGVGNGTVHPIHVGANGPKDKGIDEQ